MALMPRVGVCGVALAQRSVWSLGLFATANAEPVDRGGGHATRAEVAEKFIGTWRLKWAVTRDQAGNTHPAFDVGKLTYTAQGDVWAFMGNRGQPGGWFTGNLRREAEDAHRGPPRPVLVGPEPEWHRPGGGPTTFAATR